MSPPSVPVLLVVGYAVFLVAAAWGFDLMSRRVARRSGSWRTGSFVYHADHDAWQCPQDQWLWPRSFDPEHRVMRYRGSPAVCNACPVKAGCTTSAHGREVTREVDPWPHSEAGRFHRGIAVVVASLAGLLPLATLPAARSTSDVVVLALAVAAVVVVCLPLAKHLWRTPSGFPPHVPQQRLYELTTRPSRYASDRRPPSGRPAPDAERPG